MDEPPPATGHRGNVVVWREATATLAFRPEGEQRNIAPLWPASAPDGEASTERSLAHDVASRVSDAIDATVEPLMVGIADAVAAALATELGPQRDAAAAQLDILATLARGDGGEPAIGRRFDDAAAFVRDVVWRPAGEAATLALFDALVAGEPWLHLGAASWAERAVDGLFRASFARVASIGETDVDRVLRVAAPAALRWLAAQDLPDVIGYRDRWVRPLHVDADALVVELARPTVVVEHGRRRSTVVPFVPAEVRAASGRLVLVLDLGDRKETVVLPADIQDGTDVEVDGSAIVAPIRRGALVGDGDTSVTQELGRRWMRFDAVDPTARRRRVPATAPQKRVAEPPRLVTLAAFFADGELSAAGVAPRLASVGGEVVGIHPDVALAVPCDFTLNVPAHVAMADVVAAVGGSGRSAVVTAPALSADTSLAEIRLTGLDRPGALRDACRELAGMDAFVARWTGRTSSANPYAFIGQEPSLEVLVLALLDDRLSHAQVRDRLAEASGCDVQVGAPSFDAVFVPSHGPGRPAPVLTLAGEGGWVGVVDALDRIARTGFDLVASSLRADRMSWAGTFAVRQGASGHIFGNTSFELLRKVLEKGPCTVLGAVAPIEDDDWVEVALEAEGPSSLHPDTIAGFARAGARVDEYESALLGGEGEYVNVFRLILTDRAAAAEVEAVAASLGYAQPEVSFVDFGEAATRPPVTWYGEVALGPDLGWFPGPGERPQGISSSTVFGPLQP